MTIYLTERRHGPDGEYVQKWLTPPPEPGIRYRVLEDEWDDAGDERRILTIEVLS